MFNVQAFDETWGEHRPNSRKASAPTYADMKSLVCHTVTIMLKDILSTATEYRCKTLREVPGTDYAVLVEWCVDGQLAPEDDTRSQWTSSDYGLQYAVVINGTRSITDK
jgi:hypothetical protein